MYDYMIGTVKEINSNSIVLETNNIGYLIYTPNPFSFEEEKDYKIYLYQQIKEDEHLLFGFKEKNDKEKWLDIYYPSITKRVFPIYENESKADTIIEYCKNNNISLDEVIFVDDVITILREAEKKGINAWHISSFLDWTI